MNYYIGHHYKVVGIVWENAGQEVPPPYPPFHVGVPPYIIMPSSSSSSFLTSFTTFHMDACFILYLCGESLFV